MYFRRSKIHEANSDRTSSKTMVLGIHIKYSWDNGRIDGYYQSIGTTV